MTKNIIAFQKGIIVTCDQGIDNRNLAMGVQAELMRFGYMLDQDALNQLGYSDSADIIQFNNEIVEYLLDITGGKHNYQPLYKGFPQQVIESTQFDLWNQQMIHYYSNGKFESNEWTKTKPQAFEQPNYRMLSIANDDMFMDIFKSLASSGQSLTSTDLKVIEWFIGNYPTIVFPEKIPFKENLCTIIGKLVSMKRDLNTVTLPKLTTKDVLRVVVYLSGGDISLPAVPKKFIVNRELSGRRWSAVKELNPERSAFKFKKFKRSERRTILGILEQSNLNVKDMVLLKQRWVKLGEILHPGEWQELYPKTFKAFDAIRNTKVVSWYGEVEAIRKESFVLYLQKLAERPTEFVRKLDYLLRTYNTNTNMQQILDQFSKIGLSSSNKVLFEVFDHFVDRVNPVTDRSIFIKGARKRTPLPNLPAMKQVVIEAVQNTIFDILKSKFALLEPIGDCWIDPELKKIPLPTNMRSMSEALVPVIRGQRIPLNMPNAKVIRAYIHWYNPGNIQGGCDIDLSGIIIGKQSILVGWNGRNNFNGAVYSGDVTDRLGPCAEYIDLNLEKLRDSGFKYVVLSANDYRYSHGHAGKGFSIYQDCVFGCQEREFAEANENWKPDTIANAIKVTSTAPGIILAMIDLEAMEYIFIDSDSSKSVASTDGKYINEILKQYCELPKISVYDLVKWHVEARGREVGKDVAEKHFLFEDFSTNYVNVIELLGV